ncbi:lipopolysaccharide core biosynthesis protein [Pseudomonas borbori]
MNANDSTGAIEQQLEAYWDGGRPFESCRGKYSGAVFIIASGPSAGAFPVERYGHIPMIAMNGSIMRFADSSIRPLFYLCDDRGFVRLRLPLVRQGIQRSQHAALGYGALEVLLQNDSEAVDDHSIFLMQRTNRPINGRVLSDRRYAWRAQKDPDIECDFSLLRQKPNRIGFSRNMSKGYFIGRTIPFAALQLAYHLGFTKVFLVGVDLNAQPGRFYEQGEAALPTRLDDDFDDYILPSFELLAKRVVGEHFKVFNMSSASRLPRELFPYVAPDQLDDLLTSS